jgi:AbrB family looped-hinge helix DNA binding protein
MSVVTVSPRFQVVIPRQIREALKLEPGQKVQAFEYEGRVEFVPVRPAAGFFAPAIERLDDLVVSTRCSGESCASATRARRWGQT